MNQLQESLYHLPEETSDPYPDCHVYVLGSKNSFFLCDAGNGNHSFRKIETLKENGFLLEHCKGIIFTHLHFDHIKGARDFQKETHMHEYDALLLEQNEDAPFGFEGMKTMAANMGHDVLMPMINHILHDKDIIKVAGEEWEVIHTPGHTPGSICLYNKKTETLISGDTLFAGSIGRCDVIGSSVESMHDSIKRLEEMKIKHILPGHGRLVLDVNKEDYFRKVIQRFFDSPTLSQTFLCIL